MRIAARDSKTGRIMAGQRMSTSEELETIFWQNVEIIPFHTCWEWIGAKMERGYGRIHLGLHKFMSVHRYSLSLIEPLKEGLVVDHICRNRGCVNPKHLRQVTPRVNSLENSRGMGALNAAKTHCKHGHEFTLENTGTQYRGKNRRCKTCTRIGATRRARLYRAIARANN